MSSSSSSSEEELTVVIVGAGMAGLSMALSLAKNLGNVKIDVLEKRSNALEQKGSAYGLALNGQKAMEEISMTVLEHCRQVGVPMFTGAYMLPWFEVRNALWKECQQQPSVTIRTGVEPTSIQETPSGVHVQYKDSNSSSTGTTTTIVADLVIGADGVHSAVRSDVLGLPKARPMGSMLWRGCVDTTRDGSKLSGIHQTSLFAAKRPNKTIRIGKTMVMLFSFAKVGVLGWIVSSQLHQHIHNDTTPWQVLQHEGDEFLETPYTTRQSIQQILDESDARDLNHHTKVCTTPLLPSSSWGGRGRITLIGDAAHAIMPTSGLGGALAFEDVVILTRQVVAAVQKRQGTTTNNKHWKEVEIPLAIQAFQQQRFPRVQRISQEQLELSKGFRGAQQLNLWSKDYEKWVYMGPDAPSHFEPETATKTTTTTDKTKDPKAASPKDDDKKKAVKEEKKKKKGVFKRLFKR